MIRCGNRKQCFWSQILVFNKRFVLSGYHHLLCIAFETYSPIVRVGHVPTPSICMEIVNKVAAANDEYALFAQWRELLANLKME